MYLRGLGDCSPAYTTTVAVRTDCTDKGGTIGAQLTGASIGQPVTWQCNFPPQCSAPPPVPRQMPTTVNVSVPTNVNTQVSPQISPNLIQQQQPTNSPVGASTAASPSQSAGDAAFSDYLKQLAAQQAKEHDDMMALLAQSQATQAQPAMQNAPMQTETYTESPVPANAASAPVTVAPMKADHTIAYLIAALVGLGGVAYITGQRKGKRNVHARH